MPVNVDMLEMMGAGGFQSPGPITTGNVKPIDWDLITMMLGGAGQAMSAGEPTSWQHQMGGMATGLAKSRKFAQAATKARAGQRSQTQMLIDLLGGKPTPQGIPGLTKYEVGPKGEIKMSLTPDREGFSDLFGFEPLKLGSTGEGMYPTTETPEPGGAGGRDVMHPFFEGLPEPSSQLRTW